MPRRRSARDDSPAPPAAPLLGSHLRDGVVTLAVIVLALVLAYDANRGLPFLPTYRLDAVVPDGANLIEANEVRVGGFRVGIVDGIESRLDRDGAGEPRTVTVLHLKLDTTVEELPRDTRLVVRPRSVAGLKYVDLRPGSSGRTFAPGETIPLANADDAAPELDEMLATFDESTRRDMQAVTDAGASALAGRGEAVNRTLGELPPAEKALGPVMASLSDPGTALSATLDELRDTMAEVAPVATPTAALFGQMADTFEAASRDPEALGAGLERTAPTLDAATRSTETQEPVLEEGTALGHELRAPASLLTRSLPRVASALRAGTPVLARAPGSSEEARKLVEAATDLTQDPSTLVALRDLRSGLTVGAPLVEYVAPYQTVCNYAVYGMTYQGEASSMPLGGGNAVLGLMKQGNTTQDDRVSDSNADRPADVPSDQDPQDPEPDPRTSRATDEVEQEIDRLRGLLDDPTGSVPRRFRKLVPPALAGTPVQDLAAPVRDSIFAATRARLDRLRRELRLLQEESRRPREVFHVQSSQPAIDGQGNADCQTGQNGYLDRLITTGRYPPSDDPEKNGGSHVVVDPDTPGLAGPTFTGVPRLQAVDAEQRPRHPRGEVP